MNIDKLPIMHSIAEMQMQESEKPVHYSMREIYPQLRFVWDELDRLREEAESEDTPVSLQEYRDAVDEALESQGRAQDLEGAIRQSLAMIDTLANGAAAAFDEQLTEIYGKLEDAL